MQDTSNTGKSVQKDMESDIAQENHQCMKAFNPCISVQTPM